MNMLIFFFFSFIFYYFVFLSFEWLLRLDFHTTVVVEMDLS